MGRIGLLELALVISTLLAGPAYAQQAQPRPQVPMTYKYWLQLQGKPGAVGQLGASLPPVAPEKGTAPLPPLKNFANLKALGSIAALQELSGMNELRALGTPDVIGQLKQSGFAPEGTPGSLWSTLTNTPPGGPFNLGNPLLLTDGTVIVHRTDTVEWYRLTPSNTGSYVNGKWTQIASMPSGYAPKFFASAVLPDGRVIAEGGEYNNNNQDWTALGAIYDPTAGAGGSWTAVSPPNGWTEIGDAQAVVLANGTFMLANCCQGPPFLSALLKPANLIWTATGTNKADKYDEESWTLLPDTSVLTVDAYTTSINGIACGVSTERYQASTGAWSAAGSVPAQLADCNDANTESGANPSFEIGPQVLMYNGKVIAFGGTTANVVHTVLYDIAHKSWSAGPNLPSNCGPNGNLPCTLADAPATLLPSGNVLLVASAGKFNPPANFFEYSAAANSFASVPGTTDALKITSFYVNFLTLPTGQILAVENYTPTVQIYSPSGAVSDSWRPVVTSVQSCVKPGESYVVSGKQLNGLSQGASYGDDQQAATNYPLVRIVNNTTGHVFYARTWDISTMTVAPNATGSTHFSVAAATETGTSKLYVVANGIPSAGTAVMVAATACPNVAATNK